MGASEVRWLLRELPALVERGVLDPGAAAGIRSHYRSRGIRRTSASVLVVVFGALGAVLIAAGVLLLLAHNWDELPTPTRVALAFAPLIAAQAVAVWVRLRRFRSAAWREGAAGFLAMSSGGCLALVGQIYHLPFTLGELLLTWSVLALPLVYLLRSRLVATLYGIGITAWLCAGPAEFVPPHRVLGYALLAAALAPVLAGSARRASGDRTLALPAWLILGSLVAGTFRTAWGSPVAVWFVLCAGLFGALHGVAARSRGEGHAGHAARWLGALGVAGGVILLSYRGAWSGAIDGLREGMFSGGTLDARFATTVTTLGVGLALVALAVPAGMRLLRERRWHEGATALAVVPVAAGLGLGLRSTGFTAPALVINLYGVALGLLACREGLRAGRLATANFGLLLVSAVLVARFFDVDLSFVARGVGFVALGALFLTVNLVMLARRREATT